MIKLVGRVFRSGLLRLLTGCIIMIGGVSYTATATVVLPSVLASNMVLQQKDSVRFWGWGQPGEKVFITPSWNGKADSTITTGDARWELKIATPAAGGPFTIEVKGQNVINLENVLVGEVWVCSGQSNMEWSYSYGLDQMTEEFTNADKLNLRFFQVVKSTSENPQDDCRATWMVCDSNTLKKFSAVAYYFGKKLNGDLNTPIGLINSSWGGTPAEVWTPREIVDKDPELKEAAAKLSPFAWWPVSSGYTYNAMIAPLTPFNVRGAIWYQGESNVNTASTYTKLFTAMIRSWREKWNRELPFYYVQIAPYTYGDSLNAGAYLREQQTRSLRLPETGMVVISDLVDDTSNIHPTNKRDVGLRLANLALAKTYDRNTNGFHSPSFTKLTIDGKNAVVEFDNKSDGLVIKGKDVSQLMIAGEDRIFYPARGRVRNGRLIVTAPQVKRPVAVRYQFTNAGIGNLTSKEGLPVAPFRTDDWPEKELRYAQNNAGGVR